MSITTKLRHIFSARSHSHAVARRRSRTLGRFEFLDQLEDRLVLTTDNFSASGYTLNLFLNVPNQVVAVTTTANSTEYDFRLSGGSTNTWSGSAGSASTVNELLRVSASAYTTINISTGGSATGTGVAFNDSTGSSFNTNFNITLNSSPGTVVFNGTTNLTGSYAFTATTDKNISFNSGSSLSLVNGNLTLSANQQPTPTSGLFSGVSLTNSTVQITGTGALDVRGKGGTDSGGSQVGVLVDSGSKLIGGTAGTATVRGTGGASTGNSNEGVWVKGGVSPNVSRISTLGAALSIAGTGGGSGSANSNDGVLLGSGADPGVLATGGTGTVSLTGTEGVGSGSRAIDLLGSSSVTSGGNLTLAGNSLVIAGTATVTAGSNVVTILERTSGVAIDLGSTTETAGGPLAISNAELGRITAGTINVGDANAGLMTISQPITATTNLNLATASSSAGLTPLASGTDLTLTSGKTLGLASVSSLNIAINGPTVDTGYTQFRVAGAPVSLTGMSLNLSGSYASANNQVFTIVSASAGVSGAFTGLADGTTVTLNGRSLVIHYTATSVTLTDATGTANFNALDLTTQGNWKGTYGGDGWNVSQDASANNPAYPSYATVTFSNTGDYTWNDSTTNVRALQKTAINSPSRIAACWYNADNFSVDVHITDGQTHQVALYALDWSSTVRSQSVQVIDDTTGNILDTRSLTDFHNGAYLVWTIGGNVNFKITNTDVVHYTNAVLSGLFFGGPASSSSGASYVTTDTTTQGNWKGVYGADGWNVSQDVGANNPAYPSYANVTFRSAGNFTWNSSTANPLALQKTALNAQDRIAGTWFSGDSFSINVNITDGQTHQVALYAIDWDTTSRSETITVVDEASGNVLNSRSLSSFHNGAYLIWNIHGNVTFKITNTGPSNAVISGLFFGGSPNSNTSATFVTTDTTTQGNWKGAYGANGYDLSQDPSANNPSIPAYASLDLHNAANYTWSATTSDARALQKAAVGSTSRVAATWYNNNRFSADVNLTDGQTHQIALYALDWENIGRTEMIQVIDTATGAVLDTRNLSGFQNGVYLVWNVRGSVTFNIVNTNPAQNAVISGIFFG